MGDAMSGDASYPIVIVGTGFAGYTVAREVRRRDRDVRMLMVSREEGNQYSKPMLSNAFLEKMSMEQLAGLSKDQMAKRLKATILSQTGVDRIDVAARCVHLSDGSCVGYGKLVLAVGARPRLPKFLGRAASEILSVNSLQDYVALRSALEGAKRVTVIGAGLVGCELANDLLSGGYSVDLLDLSPRVLDRLLPHAAAEAVTDALVAAGVRWHPDSQVRSVDFADGNESRLVITGEHGLSIACDVAIAAIGLDPEVIQSQPPLETARGIVVDAYLKTSARDVYAIGDCAEIDGAVLPYLLPVQIGAKALAATLTGVDTAVDYPPMPVDVKTPAHPVRVLLPPAQSTGSWTIEVHTATGVCATFINGSGELAGYVLSGDQVSRESHFGPMMGVESI